MTIVRAGLLDSFFESTGGRRVLALALASLALQTTWAFMMPFGAGWDSGGYMSVARWYLGLPPNLWDIYQYYSPGYPFLLILSGLFYADSFEGIKLIQFAMGVLMPLLLYGIVVPWSKRLAFVTSVAFMFSTAPYFFSREVMTDHANLFFLLLSCWLVMRSPSGARPAWLVLAGLSFFVTYTLRPVGIGLPIVVAIALYLAFPSPRLRPSRARLRAPGIVLAAFLVPFVVASALFSVFLGEGPKLGITRNYATRLEFENVYMGAASYFGAWGSVDWHLPFGWDGLSKVAAPPGEGRLAPAIVPANGPAATELFQTFHDIEANNPDWPDSPLGQQFGDADAHIAYMIKRPVGINAYNFWWVLDSLGAGRGEQLEQAATVEALFKHPAIVEYFADNCWNFLFGPSKKFDEDRVSYYWIPEDQQAQVNAADTTAFSKSLFSLFIGPGAIGELDAFAPPGQLAHWVGGVAAQLMTGVALIKPLLMLLTTVMGVTALRNKHPLLLLCAGIPVYHALVTSIAIPGHFPYWFPTIPFMIVGSVFGVARADAVVRRGWAMPEWFVRAGRRPPEPVG